MPACRNIKLFILIYWECYKRLLPQTLLPATLGAGMGLLLAALCDVKGSLLYLFVAPFLITTLPAGIHAINIYFELKEKE